MLLTLDIGNTEITAGLFRGRRAGSALAADHQPRSHARTSGAARSAAFLIQAGHSPNEVRAVCLASVAPSVTQSVVEGVARSTGCTGVAVDAAVPAAGDAGRGRAAHRRRRSHRQRAGRGRALPAQTPSWWTSAPPPPSTASRPTRASSAGSSCLGFAPRPTSSPDARPSFRPPSSGRRPTGDRPAHRGVHPGRGALRHRRRGGRHRSPDPGGVARRPDARRRGDGRSRLRHRAAHHHYRADRSAISPSRGSGIAAGHLGLEW